MAEIIHSTRFKAGDKAVLHPSNTIGFSGGRLVENCPALFDKIYNYVTQANLWLIYLLDEKKCKDISS